MSRKIAVVGLGNTLRRDDGIGIIILESLLNFYKREGIDYLDFGSASFDLLHRIKDYQTVILIDGVHAGLNAGELKICALKDVEYRLDNPAGSTHELSLKNFFELAKRLENKAKIFIAGIQVGDTSFGEGLSEGLEKNKEKISREIADFIDKKLCFPH